LRSPTTQTGAVAAYTRELATSPALVGAARRELAGADLVCWCRLDVVACHVDVLLRVVAGEEPRA
jgi:hypothetical protein